MIRHLLAWLNGEPSTRQVVPFEPDPDCLTCEQRMILLRRGDLDCHIPEHADALRQLGRAVMERDAARQDLDQVRLSRDNWRIRALRAEGKVRHPANQDPAEAA